MSSGMHVVPITYCCLGAVDPLTKLRKSIRKTALEHVKSKMRMRQLRNKLRTVQLHATSAQQEVRLVLPNNFVFS